MTLVQLQDNLETIVRTSSEIYSDVYDLLARRGFLPVFEIPLPLGSTVFRSRSLPEGNHFMGIHELSCPPSALVRSYNRANRPGQAMFYCSDNYITTYAELMPSWLNDVGQNQFFDVTISMWRITKPMTVAILPNPRNRRMAPLISVIKARGIPPEDECFWAFINEKFLAQGVVSQEVYQFTAAYCNAAIDLSQTTGSPIDGILYTSVQDVEGWNLAILPGSAEGCLRLEGVSQHHLQRFQVNANMPEYLEVRRPSAPARIDFETGTILWGDE